MTAPRTYVDGIALAGSVSRVLGRRSSWNKSTERGTRVRGYRLRSAGYETRDADVRGEAATVRAYVSWAMSSDTVAWSKDHDRTLRSQHAHVEELRRYVTANAAPGWQVGPIEYGDLHGYAWFYVTAPSRYAPAVTP